jgi:Tetratricopeptide repeat
MVLMSRRQAEVLEELQEWLEDVAEGGIGSRVILLAVPTGWGRSAVLARFQASVDDLDGPAAALVMIDGGQPGNRALQADGLREALTEVAPPSRGAVALERTAGVLDVDTAGGKAAMGLEVAGLFVPGLGLAGGVAVMLGSRLLSAAGRAIEDGPAGEAGAMARAARAVAAISVGLPVVVVIDDADLLDVGLARAMISGLAARQDGRVLVVAAASPDSELVTSLAKDPGHDLAGRVRKADAEPRMDYAARADLARELLPRLPDAAVERIARRTVTFGEVFAVVAADKVAELDPGAGAGEAVAVVDAVIDAVLVRAAPSREAAVLAWAGGALHDRQVDACLRVLGSARVQEDAHVRRAGALTCLADRLSPRWAEQAAAFSARQRAGLAAAVLTAAGQVAADPDARLADRVVARQAVHRVRVDLDPALRDQLPTVQCGLIRGLEALGDLQDARKVAREAIAETPPGAGRRDLLMAYLRLARPAAGSTDPIADEAIGQALAAGAAIGLEARVWAAADLLARDGNRAQAVALAGQVATELAARTRLGDAADRWRLLLAFHAGKAGLSALTQQLLAPLLASGTAKREKPALAVLHAVDGPHADVRLEVILLQAELDATPAAAEEDQLRLHAALAIAYQNLGIHRQALVHGKEELALRQRLQLPEHPSILTSRGNIAHWTGLCGDAATALRMLTALLPDLERVLGPHHSDTLTSRGNIVQWTGLCGDAPAALRLATGLLPDLERAIGPDHLTTLSTRGNIAAWTGECGDAATARDLYRALLPDFERVLGPDHPDTLTVRSNIAHWTGAGGDAAAALRLATALLPDRERALGRDHPDTLSTRHIIAHWTGEGGDVRAALRLATTLLLDLERVLGPDHPHSLTTRSSIAAWTGLCGDAATARDLYRALLPDRERVLGSGHPDTMSTRRNIAHWAAQASRGGRGHSKGNFR